MGKFLHYYFYRYVLLNIRFAFTPLGLRFFFELIKQIFLGINRLFTVYIKRPVYWTYVFKIKNPIIIYRGTKEFKENQIERAIAFSRWKSLIFYMVFVHYLFFSFTDYITLSKRHTVAAGDREVMPIIDFYAWVEPAYYYHMIIILYYIFYQMCIFAYPLKASKMLGYKIAMIPILITLTHSTYPKFWELSYETFFDIENGFNLLGWVGYFISYWALIMVQWALELEDEVDDQLTTGSTNKDPWQKKEAEAALKHANTNVDHTLLEIMDYIYELTSADWEPETPRQVFDRFFSDSTRLYGPGVMEYYMERSRPPTKTEIFSSIKGIKWAWYWYTSSLFRYLNRDKIALIKFARAVWYFRKFKKKPALAGHASYYWPDKRIWRQFFWKIFRPYKSWSYSSFRHRAFSQFLFTHKI